MKTTPRKRNANRRNARKSTGPKSESGKSAVALNGVVHGLRSLAPVLPGLEDPADWDRHRAAIVQQMAPVGSVEMAFAERIALGFWRLARSASAESRVAEGARDRAYWEEVRQTAWREDYRKGNEAGQLIKERLDQECEDARPAALIWEKVEEGPFGYAISIEDAILAIFFAVSDREWNESLDDFNEKWDWPPKTVEELREILLWFGNRSGDAPEEWVEKQAKIARTRLVDAENRRDRILRAAEFAGEKALLLGDWRDKLSRYETTIHRALLRDAHELQRLQAMRLGAIDAVPVAVDVTTDG